MERSALMDVSALQGKKFVASYSGGKDSVLAIYKAIQAGLEPLLMITTFNADAESSWFHGVPEPLLQKAAAAMGIPLTLVQTSGDDYEANFEKALTAAKQQGAEVCVFGDIDLQAHLDWCTQRCENVGLQAYFPLWQNSRKQLVYEFIDAGFATIITIVDTDRMPAEFLGLTLSRELADKIAASGADICGENGEYHSFAYDGPIFTQPVDFAIGEQVQRDHYVVLTIS